MPNLFTHHLLIKKLYAEKVTEGSFMSGNFECLALGTQGPDPLFYEGLIPFRAWRYRLASKKLGNQIHRTDGTKFMECLLAEVEKDPQAGNDEYRTFVFGQFCHYILDRVCHPYIYYTSGFDSEGKLKGKYHYAHAHFESEIDVCLALLNSMKDELKHPENLLPCKPYLMEAIEPGMRHAVSKMFDIELPHNYYENAVLNMRTVVGSVNRMPDWVAKILGKSMLVGLRLPHVVDRAILNEEHEEWLNPVTGEKHTESFLELFQKALDICEKAYDDVIKNGLSIATLKPYYDGNTYKGVAYEAKMTHKKGSN